MTDSELVMALKADLDRLGRRVAGTELLAEMVAGQARRQAAELELAKARILKHRAQLAVAPRLVGD